MYREPIQGGRNLERMEIHEFGGLNTAAFARDNEFSELLNLTNEEYPYLKTKEASSYITHGFQLLAKDAERGYENGYITAYRREEEGRSVFKYGPCHMNGDGIQIPNVFQERINESQEQLVIIGGDYLLFPSMAYAKPSKMSDGYTFKYGIAETELASSTDGYHDMLNPDGHTANILTSTEFYVNYNEALGVLKDAVDDGLLAVGDTLQFKYSGSDYKLSTLPEGFSESNLYTITAIETGKGSSDKYDAFIKFSLSATDANGTLVTHEEEIEITTTNLHNRDFIVTVTKVNPFVLGCCFGGRLFCCDVSGNSVWASQYGDFLNFRVDASDAGGAIISCGEPSRWTAIKVYNESVYCFKLDTIYRIDGSGALSYELTRVSDLGAVNQAAVCVVSDCMFFLHKSGIYSFSGGELQLMSGAIEKELEGATSGVLGGSGHMLYCAINYEEGQRLFVLNTQNGMWHEETLPGSASGNTINAIEDYAGRIMCATETGTYQLNPGGEGEIDTSAAFRLVTKKYFYIFDKKAVGEVNIKMSAEKPVYISVRYDGNEEFEGRREVKLGAGLGRVPVKLRKCTTFQIKVEGTGKAEIHALEFSLYQGGRWYGK